MSHNQFYPDKKLESVIPSFLHVFLFVVFFLGILPTHVLLAQDLEGMLDEISPDVEQFTSATFKSGRVINFHTNELIAPGNMEFRISHRFGTMNGGAYELYGLDQATIRLGFDFGITKRLMVGFGRSSYQKTFDGFIKYAIARQTTSSSMPVSIVCVASTSINSLHFSDPTRDNLFRSRMTYVYELVIARKFNENLSLELIPTLVHQNLVSSTADQNDIPVLGIGSRYKISKRVSINAEFGHRIQTKSDPSNVSSFYDTFSLGVDIDTGGHIFQLHLTNSNPMVERGFLTETTDSWMNGGIHLGFNVTRGFNIKKSK